MTENVERHNVNANTYKILLIRIFRMEQMDETTHKALLLSKVLWVWIFSWLVWLVLYQCGHQVQDSVHLEEQRVQH